MQPYDRNPANPRAAKTLPELIRASAVAYGDDPAVTLSGSAIADETLSFVALERRSAELARALIARGVGKGTRVGFLYGNGPGFVVAFCAIARIGAVAIPISTLLKANELVRVLRQSDVAGLIVQRRLLGYDYVERLCEALSELRTSGSDIRIPTAPFLRWIVSTGDDLPASVQPLDALLADAAAVDDVLLRAVEGEVHTTDQIMEIYTSGSMALPKGVKHNHGPVLFRTHYLREMIAIPRGKTINAWLPMFWIGGMMMYVLPNLEVGAITACTEGTSTSSKIAMGSVLADEDLALMGSTRPYWGLGMTETIGPYSYGNTLRLPGYPLCAPLDHIADRYDVRVADEAGAVVADGEVGEIQVRGYALTPGLHKVEREGYFTDDGFYHTGDMGFREGSRIVFVGRGGDMIKTASSNVSPAEVELEMQALDGVHSAYVVGVPDKERGQLVVAAVVPRDGATLDFGTIEGTLKQRLSSFKVPRAYVEIARDDVPMLPSNKVARRQIEAMMAERLGRA